MHLFLPVAAFRLAVGASPPAGCSWPSLRLKLSESKVEALPVNDSSTSVPSRSIICRRARSTTAALPASGANGRSNRRHRFQQMSTPLVASRGDRAPLIAARDFVGPSFRIRRFQLSTTSVATLQMQLPSVASPAPGFSPRGRSFAVEGLKCCCRLLAGLAAPSKIKKWTRASVAPSGCSKNGLARTGLRAGMNHGVRCAGGERNRELNLRCGEEERNG